MTLQRIMSKSFGGPDRLFALVRRANIRFSSDKKKDKKKPECTFKLNAQKPPCSVQASCKRTVKEPECYEGGSKLKPVCLKKKMTDFKPKLNPTASIWETEPPFDECWEEFPKFSEECCPLCPYQVRADIDFYKPKGLNRDFQQTWIECPSELIQQPSCCNEKYEMQYDYRPKQCRPSDTKAVAQSCKSTEEACKRINLAPCCKKGRIPASCKVTRGLSDCKKNCVPVPSYSECCLPAPYDMPVRGPQCYCLDRVPICVMYRAMAKSKTR